jgi:hypothetical protein
MLNSLKSHIQSYRDIDSKLQELNTEVHRLRKDRNEVESSIASLLENPEFESINMLQLKEDGSTIQIQRPNTWSKPWTLSKKDLHKYMREYFEKHSKPTPDDCYQYITQEKAKTLVSNEFSFTRIIQKQS